MQIIENRRKKQNLPSDTILRSVLECIEKKLQPVTVFMTLSLSLTEQLF